MSRSQSLEHNSLYNVYDHCHSIMFEDKGILPCVFLISNHKPDKAYCNT